MYMTKSGKKSKDPLRILSHGKGFHFYTAVGDYCGVTVHSLEYVLKAYFFILKGEIFRIG